MSMQKISVVLALFGIMAACAYAYYPSGGLSVHEGYTDGDHLVIKIVDDLDTGTRCYVATEYYGSTRKPTIACVAKVKDGR